MSNLIVSTSPHIRSKRSTTTIMLDVIIALVPAMVASVIIFGFRALLLLSVSVFTAVISEYLFNIICKKPSPIGDLSAVVTGVLLALNVPVSLPLWQMVVGAFFAIVAVKGLFGGIGQNFANPAMTARVMMILSFGTTMSTFHYPADTVASATPLFLIKGGAERMLPDTIDLLLGKYGGCLGETCSLALIAGGIYLLVRRVITWHAPVLFIGTVFVGSIAFGLPPVAEILTGGLLIGAIFMATDYSTTPVTKSGRIIFGLGCGIITLLIRKWGNYAEGVSFAILFMNILTPYIEKWTATKPLGGAK